MSEKKLNFFLDTPLGDDALIVENFNGTEEISKTYTYNIEAKSDKTSLEFDAMVGKSVTLVLTLAEDKKRFISGHVKKFTQYSRLDDLNHYHIEIVPWLWFLKQRTDCRIFQDMTALDIIKDVFNKAGFSGKYETRTSATYRRREYCVQYRETDYNFVARLMEEEGIFYFFTHTADSHKLILGDSPSAHKPLQPSGDVTFYRATGQEEQRSALMDFVAERSVRSTKVSLKDFDFVKPSTDLTVMHNESDKYELYDYPGNYTERSDGEHYAKVRLEHQRSLEKIFSGTSTERRLTTGSTFNLIEHPRDEYNATYVLKSVYHIGNQTGDAHTYTCNFECIPSDVTFRPERKAEKPFLAGCQTAVVSGPPGEEVWLDKYGRIKVQFHWDRQGKKDENSSCWVRVARGWAGKNWGFMFHPRIGQEVIVQFIEGDLDRPLVTGSVYNEEQMPPYQLPANSTKSTIKSRSSKDGTPDNFNEIRFEDKKGSEHFLIHAEKDHMVEVENNETHWVGANRNSSIDKNETIHVKGNETISIDGNRTENVEKDESISITGNRTESVEKDETISVTGNRSLSVDKNSTVSINKNETKNVGGSLDEAISKNANLNVGDSRFAEIGKKDVLQIGKEWMVDVGDKILIKCGDASISMKKDGTIEIKGKDIKVTGSGKINVKASSDLVLKGSKIVGN
ncbi:MAG TPA: type VI secretion system tip protein TssI/VgrG [Chitinispirillaceae bacterium]|nr:type VI secretion system tip protein TssI/VgrG [Chitinispirillaceae bacterium]